MASLARIGSTGALKYIDDRGGERRIAIAHIEEYFDMSGKNSVLGLKMSRDTIKLILNNKAAVTTAIALLDTII